MVRKSIGKQVRYLSNIVLALTLVSGGVNKTFGQVANTSIDHAVRILKGIDTDKTHDWAIKVLESSAVNDSSAYAMNSLGLAYMAGIGVDADSTKAVKWLECAGQGGYADAYHNLGMIFKYSRCGVRQDFERAYKYFYTGADSGSISCIYDKGFMLYKGLGCKQSYKEAVKCFQTAAESKHSPSLYMLGLCYRNGYGVEKNTAAASDYLNRSAILGYRDAREELNRNNEETYLHNLYSDSGEHSYIPNSIPNVSTEINDINLIDGNYQGHLVMYDWSGNFILGEKPLTMSANRNGSEVFGSMVVGADTVPFRAAITDNNKLTFQKGNLMLYERYEQGGKVKYRMDNMKFDLWDNKISGILNLYSLKLKEPERPMYFELHRNNVDGASQEDKYSYISISPNPFELSFKAAFELQNDADIQARIFNIYGMMEWQKELGNFKKGKNEILLSPNIKPGKYILSIKAGKQTLRTIIIKEGGI